MRTGRKAGIITFTAGYPGRDSRIWTGFHWAGNKFYKKPRITYFRKGGKVSIKGKNYPLHPPQISEPLKREAISPLPTRPNTEEAGGEEVGGEETGGEEVGGNGVAVPLTDRSPRTDGPPSGPRRGLMGNCFHKWFSRRT